MRRSRYELQSESGQQMAKYAAATTPKANSGLYVPFEMIVPVRANSWKPMIDASEVPFINWTRKPMVAGNEIRKA